MTPDDLISGLVSTVARQAAALDHLERLLTQAQTEIEKLKEASGNED